MSKRKKEVNDKHVMWLYNGLVLRTRDNPITAAEICRKVNGKYNLPQRLQLTSQDVRAVVNYMRRKKILPVVSCGKGYYTAQNAKEVEAQIKRMRSRMEEMPLYLMWLLHGLRHITAS